MNIIKTLIIFFIICLIQMTFAHGTSVHQHVVKQAYYFLENTKGPIPELRDRIGLDYNGSGEDNFPWKTGYIGVAAMREDLDDPVWGYSELNHWSPTTSHFWDADAGDDSKLPLPLASDAFNAFYKAKIYLFGGHTIFYQTKAYDANLRQVVLGYFYSYTSIIELYKTGRCFSEGYIGEDGNRYPWEPREIYMNLESARKFAVQILGRVAHLLSDMSVPAHVHNDLHADIGFLYDDHDMYEDYMSAHYNDSWYEPPYIGSLHWDALNAARQGPLVDVYQAVHTNDWSRQIRYLFYTTNQIADRFPSNDAGGDNNYVTSYNGDDYSILNINQQITDPNSPINEVNQFAFRYCIRSVAGLFYWFACETGMISKVNFKNCFNAGTLQFDQTVIPSGSYKYLMSGEIHSLTAIPQSYNNYSYIWNSNTINGKSQWKKYDEAGTICTIDNNQNMTYQLNVTIQDKNATYEAGLRKNYKIFRNDQTEFEGTTSAGIISYIAEQNSGDISPLSQFNQNGKIYNFSFWADNFSNSNPRTITPVDNTTLTAVYKTANHSDNNTNYQKNGQRRFVQTPNGILHKVYESMGTVWYEQSTDQGATWIIANGGKPLDITAQNPCIDNSDDNILISFQHVRRIKVQYFQYFYNAYIYRNEISHDLYLSEDNVYPNIAASCGVNYSPITFLLVMHNENNGIMTLKLGYSYDDFTRIAFTAINPSTDKLYINRPGSKNSSVACLKETSISKFHLAWDENGTIYYCPIYYHAGCSELLTQDSIANVSKGSGYVNNRKPSTSVIKQNINNQLIEDGKIMWMGDQITAEEPGAPLDKIQTGSGYQTKALFRDNYENNGLLIWSPFFSFGTAVCSVNINSATNTNTNNNYYYYMLGWTENNGSVSKYTNNGFTGIYNIQQGGANVTGKYLQLCNGSSLAAQNIYANIYDETALPYQFKNSGSMYFLYKETGSHGLATSRGGVAYKDNAQFYFSIGDVVVNNTKVNFVHLPDSINYSNLAEVNSLLTTEPFELNSNTPFSFSIQYGLTDSSAASALLTNGKSLNFKVLLYDVENNQLLGEYDNVTYNSNNVFQYENVNNLVNTSGINYHKVVLKLVMASNFNCNYSIAGSYSNDYALNKVGSRPINLKNSTIVTEYGMSQNYPNPFNPATTISYQLPKSGQVTIKVYDMLGREVKTLVNENKPAGSYNVSFDAGSLSSGVYIYRIVAGDYTAAKKMTLIK